MTSNKDIIKDLEETIAHYKNATNLRIAERDLTIAKIQAEITNLEIAQEKEEVKGFSVFDIRLAVTELKKVLELLGGKV